MIINSFNIDTSDLPAVETRRSFTVTGDVGAQFMIIALQNPSSPSAHTLYFDFNDSTFETGHNDLGNNLIVTLTTTVYSNAITFPSGAGEFVIKLLPIGSTTLQNPLLKAITKEISKASADAVVTFKGGALTTTVDNYATLPTKTSTGAVSASSSFTFNWDITNSSTDAYSHGLRYTDTIVNDSFWYFQETDTVNVASPKTDTVDGAISSSTALTLDTSYVTTGIAVGDFIYGSGVTNGTTVAAVNVGGDAKDITLSAAMSISDGVTLTFVTASNEVVVDDVTDLVVGMGVHEATGTNSYLTSTPRISFIDTDTKTLTLSSGEAFADGITLYFRAYGSTWIKKAIGLALSFGEVDITPTTLTTTVRANVSASTSVTLNATNGIGGGNFIAYKGLGVDNSSTNKITSVTPDPSGGDGDGVMVVQQAQTLSAGTVLTFEDIYKVINFLGSVSITQYPTANRTIYLDLDKIITPGVAS